VRTKDEDVRGWSARDAQLELYHPVDVGDNESSNRVDAELGALRRSENRRQALVNEEGIDFHKEQIAWEPAGLTETGLAASVLGIPCPRSALVLGERTPQGSDAAKLRPSKELSGRGALERNRIAATDLSVAGTDAHERALFTRLGNVEYSHK
jgi:hypothetical protein